jgi:FMN phosphatase YigB (HAD superfamily)
VAIKNILFDLGGVIIDIDYNKSATAFKKLGIANFDYLYSQCKQNNLFDDLETGQISSDFFVNAMSALLPETISKTQIIEAWNAMLLDIPTERIELIKSLQGKYRLFLLSNTNSIHYQAYHKTLYKKHGIASMNQLLEKAYYSHEIKQRKPDVSTFTYVLQDAGIQPQETLFIEDTHIHIEGAKKAGLHTWHLENQDLMASWKAIMEYIQSV